MIQIIYRWKVEEKDQSAFFAAWSTATQHIRDTTEGARGSICIVSTDDPTDVLTIAKWDHIEQWLRFVETAKSASMSEMHEHGTLVSHTAYEQKDDHTV